MTRQKRLATLGVSLACVAAGIALVITQSVAQQNRADLWKKVAEADHKGLPRTAIKELEPIIEAAIKDKNYPEAIKAIAKKIALEGNIQGNKPEEKITRMQAEIARAAGRDGAGDGRDPRPLVLALLPAEPLAVHAADRDRREPRRGHPDLGPAADLRRDRQAFAEGSRRRDRN